MKLIKVLFILSLPLHILLAQGEVNSFDFEDVYRINPHVSFSRGQSSFIICNFIYYDSEGNKRNGNIHILEFDSNKHYLSRKILKFQNSDPKKVLIKKVVESNNNYHVIFLKEKDNGYDFYSGELDFISLMVKNEELIYSINFPKNFWGQHNRLIENKNQHYLLSLDSKNKTLLVHILNDSNFVLKKFELDKKVFRNLKTDFDFFQNSSTSNEYLDYSHALKFHFFNNDLYLIKTKYNNNFTLGASSNFPIDILKLNLKNEEHERKVIDKFNINEKFADVSFSVVDDNLFYTYAFDNQIIIEKFNLTSFNRNNVVIRDKNIDSLNIKPTYSNYKKNSDKTVVENIEFKKFYNKFKNSPSISVKKITDSNYQIRIGRVVYKSSNSFGDWLGNFATSTVLGSLTSFAGNQQFYFYNYSLRNDIPIIHEMYFSYNVQKNEILKSETKSLNQKRQVILNNLNYFINKELVSPIGSSDDQEPSTFLYRKRGNWKEFFIYSFGE